MRRKSLKSEKRSRKRSLSKPCIPNNGNSIAIDDKRHGYKWIIQPERVMVVSFEPSEIPQETESVTSLLLSQCNVEYSSMCLCIFWKLQRHQAVMH